MSQITHKNLETGESVSFLAVDGSFEYQNAGGDCFALNVEGYLDTVSLDEYELVDALAFKAALVALSNRKSLGVDFRLDANALLVDLCSEVFLIAQAHHKAPNYWIVRLSEVCRYPAPRCVGERLHARVIGGGPTRHEAVVAAHSWLARNSEYRDFISMQTC